MQLQNLSSYAERGQPLRIPINPPPHNCGVLTGCRGSRVPSEGPKACHLTPPITPCVGQGVIEKHQLHGILQYYCIAE